MSSRPPVVRQGLPLAVITGAGGLAMAIARRIGFDYRLLLADRDAGALERAVEALRAEGHEADGQVCDVTDAAAVEALAARAGQIAPVQALAHVVGLSPAMGNFRAIMNVDLVGAALISKAMLPKMARGGASVFITSIAAYNPVDPAALKLCEDPLAPGLIDQLEKMLSDTSGRAAYALSKAALTRMCELQAAAWGKTGARIIALAPGLIATPMGAMEFEKNAKIKVPLLNMTPLGREGSMPEIAEVVSFLLSSGASFITGCDIRVDGGLVPTRLIAEGHR